MTFVDDVKQVRAKQEAVGVALDTIKDPLVTALYNRLRPVGTLTWLADDDLRELCGQFVDGLIFKIMYGTTPGTIAPFPRTPPDPDAEPVQPAPTALEGS